MSGANKKSSKATPKPKSGTASGAKPRSAARPAAKPQGTYAWYGHCLPIHEIGCSIQEPTDHPYHIAFFIIHEPGGGPVTGMSIGNAAHPEDILVEALGETDNEFPFPETLCVSTEEARRALKNALGDRPVQVELIPEPNYIHGFLKDLALNIKKKHFISPDSKMDSTESASHHLLLACTRYLEEQLWLDLYDTEIFRLDRNGEPAGYASVIGGRGEQIGLSLFEDPEVLLEILDETETLMIAPPSSMALLFDNVWEDSSDSEFVRVPPPEIFRFNPRGRMVDPDDNDFVLLTETVVGLLALTDVEEWPIPQGSSHEWITPAGNQTDEWRITYLGDYDEDPEGMTAELKRKSKPKKKPRKQ